MKRVAEQGYDAALIVWAELYAGPGGGSWCGLWWGGAGVWVGMAEGGGSDFDCAWCFTGSNT